MTFRECVLRAVMECDSPGDLDQLCAVASVASEHWLEGERRAWHPLAAAIRESLGAPTRLPTGACGQSGTELAGPSLPARVARIETGLALFLEEFADGLASGAPALTMQSCMATARKLALQLREDR